MSPLKAVAAGRVTPTDRSGLAPALDAAEKEAREDLRRIYAALGWNFALENLPTD